MLLFWWIAGLLAGAEDDLPRLNAEQIQKLRAVFLTHSHADHTGALPWLAQQGYRGRSMLRCLL